MQVRLIGDMQTLTRLRATCILMFAALCLAACASGPPQEGPRGDWGKAPRKPPGDEDGRPRGPRRQLFISPAGEPFRAEPGAPYPVAAWFAGADADHDGALTRDEFVADSLRFFDVLDTDHNGVIDGFEVSHYETQIAPEILQGFQGAEGGGGQGGGPPGGGRQGGGGGPPGGGGPGGGGPGGGGGKRGGGNPMGGMLQGATPYSLLAEPQPVMASDGDFDRRITRAEAAKAAKARFALLDKDGDGKIHLTDLPQTPAQARMEGPREEGRPPKR
jgi:Ca2+-binding EF-hand superfamily protein